MRQFSYAQVDDAEGGIATIINAPNSKFIAGGTTLLDLMKLYVETPEQLIDINALALAAVQETRSGVSIGALARMNDVAQTPLIRDRYPVIAEALLLSASAQLRNMATIGGNVMQRTRCSYFRDTSFPCNKREPGSGCPAISGEHRMHAILGTSDHCVATHASDLAVALVALDAVVQVQGQTGNRQIPMADFHLLPGNTPQVETGLQPGDLIVSIDLPNLPFAQRSHYLKVRDRESYEFAITSVAVALDLRNDTINAARIAFGGIGTKPWRSREAEQALQGKPATVESFRQAADAALQDAKPLPKNAFKVELAKRTLVRALETVGELT
jgi:xanthine dehydrogenase YagS FAD-binding subunit